MQADTTIGAVTSVPSVQIMPRIASPSHVRWATLVFEHQRSTGVLERPAKRLGHHPASALGSSDASRRGARRTSSAPRPVPGSLGRDAPHHRPGHHRRAAQRVGGEEASASRRRRCVGSSAASVAAPRPRRASDLLGDRGDATAGRWHCRAPSARRASPPSRSADSRRPPRDRCAPAIRWSARRRGGSSTTARRPTPCCAVPDRCRCSAGREPARPSSSITGVVRNVM